MRLDPRNHDRYLYIEGWSYTQMGRYEQAIPILKRGYPTLLAFHYLLVVDYIELGREPQARAEAAEVLRINQDETYKERVRTDLHKAGLK